MATRRAQMAESQIAQTAESQMATRRVANGRVANSANGGVANGDAASRKWQSRKERKWRSRKWRRDESQMAEPQRAHMAESQMGTQRVANGRAAKSAHGDATNTNDGVDATNATTRRMAKSTSHKSSLPATRRVANGQADATSRKWRVDEHKWPSRKWRVDERKWPSRPSLQLECDQLKASFRERSNDPVSADTGKQTWRRPRSRVEAN